MSKTAIAPVYRALRQDEAREITLTDPTTTWLYILVKAAPFKYISNIVFNQGVLLESKVSETKTSFPAKGSGCV